MTTGALTDSLRETLAIFEGRVTPWTTPEVADRLDLGRRSTYNRLERLVEHGRLETKKVGANARVWWRPTATADAAVSAGPPAAESLVDDVLEGADVGVFVLDEDFDVAWINDATERYFGLDREQVLGRDKRRLVDERIASVVEDADAFAETVLATYDDDTYTEQFECHVTAGDGREERWLEHRSKPIESGAYAGGRVELYHDVTDQRESERALQGAEHRFRTLVAAVEEYAIFLLDPDGHVRSWNDGAREIKGYETGEIVGEHFSTFYTDEDREAGVPGRNLERAAERGSVEDEGWRVRADGSRFWASVTITAVHEDGDVVGYVKVTRDMTERREHERTIEQILETSPVGIAVLEDDGTLGPVNSRAWELLGVDDDAAAEFVDGERDLFDAGGEPRHEATEPVVEALETGEPVSDREVEVAADDRQWWLSINAAPIPDDDGAVDRVVATADDVTQLKTQAARLERERDEIATELEAVFDRVDDAFFAVDEEWRFTYLNEQGVEVVASIVGGDPTARELVGANLWETVPEAVDTAFHEQNRDAMTTQEPRTFEAYFEPLSTWFEVRAYPSESGLSVYFSDVTDRKDRERELEQYEAIVETIEEGVYIVDGEGEFVWVNSAYAEMTGYSPAELVGAHVSKVVDEETVRDARAREERLEAGDRDGGILEADVQPADGESFPAAATFTLLSDDEEDGRRIGVVRDVTERKERERELEESRQRYQTLVENFPNGAVVLFDEDLRYLTVGGSVYESLDFSADDLAGDTIPEHVPPGILDTIEPRYRAVFDGESSEFELEYDGEIRHFRVFPVYDDDGTVFAGMVMSQDVTERRERERELERQREQLAVLNNLNGVVRDITDAVIERSTREEIEATVCERLAESDSYEFAWIAEVDPQTRSITPRVEAGVDGYLEEIPLSTESDEPAGQGPSGRALRTREIQTTRDAMTDPDFEPWREHASEYGYQSAAAIPIVHGDVLYGLLGVYADRPDAFESQEQDVIGQLGDVVGHAIAAIERKQALTSDEITEIEFTIPDVAEVVGLEFDVDGTIAFERAVSTSDGAYLQYGTVDVDAIDALEGFVDRMSHFEAVTIVDRGAETARFELRLSDAPVVSVVASHGGYLQRATVEDGDFHLTIHLPVTVEARRIVDAVQDAYPTADLLRRRQITRPDDTFVRMHREVTGTLSDRQRATLEAAYHAGFFEWPRDASGEEVAESLGIAPSTFSQHLRKGQRRVFASLFSTSTPAQ